MLDWIPDYIDKTALFVTLMQAQEDEPKTSYEPRWTEPVKTEASNGRLHEEVTRLGSMMLHTWYEK